LAAQRTSQFVTKSLARLTLPTGVWLPVRHCVSVLLPTTSVWTRCTHIDCKKVYPRRHENKKRGDRSDGRDPSGARAIDGRLPMYGRDRGGLSFDAQWCTL